MSDTKKARSAMTARTRPCHCCCCRHQHHVDGPNEALGQDRAPRERLRVWEFAEYIGMNESTIRDLIKAKRITIHKVGRSVYIPVSEADRILTEALRPARESISGGRFGHR